MGHAHSTWLSALMVLGLGCGTPVDEGGIAETLRQTGQSEGKGDALGELPGGGNKERAPACRANDVRMDVDLPIYISDVAITLQRDDCPGARLPLSEPIVTAFGSETQIWFRVQGHYDYLRSPEGLKPLVVSLQRRFEGIKYKNRYYQYGAFAIPPIDVLSVAEEIADNDGRFDYRIWVRDHLLPGDYTAVVLSNLNEVGVLNADRTALERGVSFSIKEPF